MFTTLSGSINVSDFFSGSFDKNDFPVALLSFERSGEMNLIILDEGDPIESSSILMLTNFFEFALSKDDWMSEYANSVKDMSTDLLKEKAKPNLRLIKGGLSNTGSFC